MERGGRGGGVGGGGASELCGGMGKKVGGREWGGYPDGWGEGGAKRSARGTQRWGGQKNTGEIMSMPQPGIAPGTFSLQERCSTTEPLRQTGEPEKIPKENAASQKVWYKKPNPQSSPPHLQKPFNTKNTLTCNASLAVLLEDKMGAFAAAFSIRCGSAQREI